APIGSTFTSCIARTRRPRSRKPCARSMIWCDRARCASSAARNLSAQQVVEAQATARQHVLAAFVSCQNEYSLLAREVERELIPTAKALGLGILPYFPLGSGLLTGKYKRGAALPPGSRLAKNPRHAQEFINERNWRIVGELETFAARRGHTMLELAFSWLLREGVVASVIAGATTPEQVEQNVRAAGWRLSAEDLAEIDRITL